MQFKPITAIIVLSLVVASLSLTGCTTTVNNQTISPETPSGNMTAKLDNAFTSKNFTIIKPFTRAVNQFGNVVYTCTVKDGENKLVPYVHNITLEDTKSRNDSLSRFNAYVAQALKQGYPLTENQTGYWYGVKGDIVAPTSAIAININQPNSQLSWSHA